MQKRLLLLDGYGFLFRSYYAMPSLNSSDGVPIGGVYGAMKTIISILEKNTNNYVVVALDGSGGTFRNEMFADYKSNRKEPPEDLLPQFDIFDEALEMMGVKFLRMKNYEADDIIASYCFIAKNNGFFSHIYSSDKDMIQLVDEKVAIVDIKKRVTIDAKYVEENIGVQVSQFIDYLSLIGDKSDNVPGVHGIGKVNAVKLLKKYKTLEGIYNNIDDVGQVKIRESLANQKKEAFLSRRLIELCNKIDNMPSIKELLFEDFNRAKMQEFADKYGFRNIFTSSDEDNKSRNPLLVDNSQMQLI